MNKKDNVKKTREQLEVDLASLGFDQDEQSVGDSSPGVQDMSKTQVEIQILLDYLYKHPDGVIS